MTIEKSDIESYEEAKSIINVSIGESVQIISDFLPSPNELALKEENVKITIALSKESVSYFKGEAQKNHTQYQKMIRNLLDSYVTHQKSLTITCSGQRKIG